MCSLGCRTLGVVTGWIPAFVSKNPRVPIVAEGFLMQMTADPLVSLVTPMYNEVEHIAECVESVLSQTYRHWEYTIVDNCSCDGSLEIARSYARREPRIRVVTYPHFLDVIPNHNVAVRQISARSSYCKMVFGDDWIFPECLERMVAVGENHPSVGIIGAFVQQGERVLCTDLPSEVAVVSGREVCRRHLLEGLQVFASANGVLYRASLVREREAFYNETNFHADMEVYFRALKEWDYGFVHKILTFSRIRPGSLRTLSADVGTGFSGMLEILARYGGHT